MFQLLLFPQPCHHQAATLPGQNLQPSKRNAKFRPQYLVIQVPWNRTLKFISKDAMIKEYKITGRFEIFRRNWSWSIHTSGSKSWVTRMLFGLMSRCTMQPTLHSSWRYRRPRAAPTAIFCLADHSNASWLVPETISKKTFEWSSNYSQTMYMPIK